MRVSQNRNNSNSNGTSNTDETKQYLKQLIDDMQEIKVEMNKMRVTTAQAPARVRSDSLRVNLKELRNDIEAIRIRMAMTPKMAKQ